MAPIVEGTVEQGHPSPHRARGASRSSPQRSGRSRRCCGVRHPAPERPPAPGPLQHGAWHRDGGIPVSREALPSRRLVLASPRGMDAVGPPLPSAWRVAGPASEEGLPPESEGKRDWRSFFGRRLTVSDSGRYGEHRSAVLARRPIRVAAQNARSDQRGGHPSAASSRRPYPAICGGA